MKENFNPYHVSLSREFYDILVTMAEKDHSEETAGLLAKVKRHARKFNEPLRRERRQQLIMQDTGRKEMKKNIREFFETHKDKTVYRVIHGHKSMVYIPCTMKELRLKRLRILVRHNTLTASPLTQAVLLPFLILEVPKDAKANDAGLYIRAME